MRWSDRVKDDDDRVKDNDRRPLFPIHMLTCSQLVSSCSHRPYTVSRNDQRMQENECIDNPLSLTRPGAPQPTTITTTHNTVSVPPACHRCVHPVHPLTQFIICAITLRNADALMAHPARALLPVYVLLEPRALVLQP